MAILDNLTRLVAAQAFTSSGAVTTNSLPLKVAGRDIAKGEPDTAKLRLDRDITESLYKSCLEGINVYKVKLRVLENQLEREWGQAKRG